MKYQWLVVIYFNKIDQCLQEIFDCKKVFGGRHVVAIGDFYQMKPVKDTYIFKNPDSSYSALATNTWTDHFKIFTLVEIMRQCDEKEFCEVLNRLRKAQCTQADDDLFQSCIVDKNSTKYNPYVRHIYPFRNATDKHNDEIFDKAKEYKEIVESQDFLIGTHSHEELTKCLMKIKTQAKYELISGLHRNLKLAVNCVYAISCNVNTYDGLINGAICTLKYVEYINQQITIRPSILWVHF